VHHPSAGQRRQVRRPLRTRLARHAPRDRAEHEHADQQRREARDEQDRGLPAAPSRRPGTLAFVAGHDP
jgi:hypothetical protein